MFILKYTAWIELKLDKKKSHLNLELKEIEENVFAQLPYDTTTSLLSMVSHLGNLSI